METQTKTSIALQFFEKSREQWLIRYLAQEKTDFIYRESPSQAQVILRQKEDRTGFELVRYPEEEILSILSDDWMVSDLFHEIRKRTRTETRSDDRIQPFSKGKGDYPDLRKPEEDNMNEQTEDYPGLCSVFSPAGGCGKTSFAIAYALEQARRDPGKKVLYWSLQRTEDWPLYFRSTSDYNLSDILYSLLSEDQAQLTEVLEKAIQRQENGIYLIRPCNHIQDLSSLEEQDLERLLILLTSCFETVICDMNSSFDELNARILQRSGKCFFLINDLSMVRVKWMNFLEQLDRNQMKEVYLKKAVLVCICEKNGEGKNITRSFTGPVYFLPWSGRLCKEQNGLLQIRQDSNYYECIQKMV